MAGIESGNLADVRTTEGKLIVDVSRSTGGDPDFIDCAADGTVWTATIRGWSYAPHVGLAPTRDKAIERLATECGTTVERLRAEAIFEGDADPIEVNLRPLDVGFDLRATGDAVNLPDAERLKVLYVDQDGQDATVEGDRETVGKALEAAGYRIGSRTERSGLPGAEFRRAAFDVVDRLRARRRMGDNPTVRIIVDLVLCDGTDAESLARGWLAQADLDALDNDHASAMINVMGLLPELSTEALQDLAEHLRRTDGPQADAE